MLTDFEKMVPADEFNEFKLEPFVMPFLNEKLARRKWERWERAGFLTPGGSYDGGGYPDQGGDFGYDGDTLL